MCMIVFGIDPIEYWPIKYFSFFPEAFGDSLFFFL